MLAARLPRPEGFSPTVVVTLEPCATDHAVERSLARYGYEVIHARPSQGESPEFQRAVDRANELLHLLEL